LTVLKAAYLKSKLAETPEPYYSFSDPSLSYTALPFTYPYSLSKLNFAFV